MDRQIHLGGGLLFVDDQPFVNHYITFHFSNAKSVLVAKEITRGWLLRCVAVERWVDINCHFL